MLGKKQPWLAFLLNLIPLPIGLGYVYLALWKRAIITCVLRTLVIMAGWMVAGLYVTSISGFVLELRHIILAFALWLIPVGLISAATAWDARRLTFRRNLVGYTSQVTDSETLTGLISGKEAARR